MVGIFGTSFRINIDSSTFGALFIIVEFYSVTDSETKKAFIIRITSQFFLDQSQFNWFPAKTIGFWLADLSGLVYQLEGFCLAETTWTHVQL